MSETVVVRPSLLYSLTLRRLSALAVFAGASTVALHAQQVAPQDVSAGAQPATQLVAEVQKPPVDLSTTIAGLSYSSSSSDVSTPVDPIAAERLNLGEGAGSGLQPPPRRRYGRPRYNDSSHNPDGSNKYVFEGAVGLTLATGDSHHYFNTSYGIQVGGGRQFNQNFAVLLQFDYDRFGINKNTLDSQAALYNGLNSTDDSGCGPGQGENNCATPVDGNNHVWSFTLNPTYTFLHGDKYGMYVVVGAGFYHKVTTFTTPQAVCLDIFCEFQGEENESFDHYSSNAVGGNAGFGITYKASRFSGERLFFEARYVLVDNSQRQGFIFANNTTGFAPTGPNPDPNNAFPANSNKTSYIPIKFGIRF